MTIILRYRVYIREYFGGFCKIKDLKSKTCALFAHATVLAFRPVKCILQVSRHIVGKNPKGSVLSYCSIMHYISARINSLKKLYK